MKTVVEKNNYNHINKDIIYGVKFFLSNISYDKKEDWKMSKSIMSV